MVPLISFAFLSSFKCLETVGCAKGSTSTISPQIQVSTDNKYSMIATRAGCPNVICLYLLQKSTSKEAHMQASMIFTSNDVIINSGVIIAGIMVYLLKSSYPDLIIGGVVFVIVARGAYRILKLAK